MPEKYLIHRRFLVEDIQEGNIDEIREKFKEKATVDNLESWESKEEMENYNASMFITKARYYFSQTSPDLVQSAEKLWFAAVYAVKKLYLTSGGVNLKSHNSLKFFVRFALKHASLSDNLFWHLHDSWTKAEK
ncbi:unnamed protein product [Auanema sp. JU1783]|nr:unnamed protein product [Auanema sp. JU1783]